MWTDATVTETILQRRKMLLHLKCLFWCLNQMQTRYDLNLVLYSLEHHMVHAEITDSNLGDNVAYLIEHLEVEDLGRLAEALRRLPDPNPMVDRDDKQFILGHYVQALDDFGPISDGSYGVISSLTPTLRGLFLIDGGHLFESPFDAPDVRVIFGTYIV